VANKDFPSVFRHLKTMLKPFESRLVITADRVGSYSLNTPYSQKYKKEVFAAAVQVKKNYVSYYLMPVYMFPEMIQGISLQLKKHMQGKSCFNFTAIEPDLFEELSQLTMKGFQRFQSEIAPLPSAEPH
jgi:hypothetical protein